MSEEDGCLVCEFQRVWVGPLAMLIMVMVLGLTAVYLQVRKGTGLEMR